MMPSAEVGIGHCITILKIRKKLFVIPALSVLGLTILVAGLLPSTYESSSTILIEEQQIPQDFVRSTVTGFAETPGEIHYTHTHMVTVDMDLLRRNRLMVPDSDEPPGEA